MRIGIVRYPGSHGADALRQIFASTLGHEVYEIQHEDRDTRNPDLLVLPGGSSFGDYLRPGALASVSRISGAIRVFVEDGGKVVGIGNGFQILTELGILPGSLLTNPSGGFHSGRAFLKIESQASSFTSELAHDEVYELPLACYTGSYVADSRTLRELEDGGHVAFRYCDSYGDVSLDDGYNGCANSIAGITSRHHNALGLMARPDRAVDEGPGLQILRSFCTSH